LIKLLPYILFEKYINILAVEMVSPGIRHCVYLSPSGVCRKVSRCSVLVGMSGHFLSVLDAAARLVFSVRCSEHITPLLHDLHWLRVPERIRFRL